MNIPIAFDGSAHADAAIDDLASAGLPDRVQFPSIVGRLAGLIGAAVLVRWRVGLPLATEPSAMPAAAGVATTSPHAQAPMSLARAIMPLAATVLLLAVTRIDAMGLKAQIEGQTVRIGSQRFLAGENMELPAELVEHNIWNNFDLGPWGKRPSVPPKVARAEASRAPTADESSGSESD
jgi:hypothetical protein